MCESNRTLEQRIHGVISRILADSEKKTALIGYDGYVDALYRVVKTRRWDGAPEYYDTIGEYGRRICAADGRSADIDLCLQSKRFGGNAPLMANALAALGDAPVLIGALGMPEMDASFDTMRPEVERFSFAAPCQTIALEFNDGKIMMGDTNNAAQVCWERILKSVGEGALTDALSKAVFVAVLNWSALPGVGQIALELDARMAPSQAMFADLSDPTSLPADRLYALLQILRDIGSRRPLILGMNENEAEVVLRATLPDVPPGDDFRTTARRCGERLRQTLNLKCLTIHANAYALGFDAQGAVSSYGFLVDRTRFSTGAGDHYNAAFCHGYMCSWPLEDCLTFSSAASSYYVRYGASPDRRELASYLQTFLMPSKEA